MFHRPRRHRHRTGGTADNPQCENQSDIFPQATNPAPKGRPFPRDRIKCGFHESGRKSRRMSVSAGRQPASSAEPGSEGYRSDNRLNVLCHDFRRFIVFSPAAVKLTVWKIVQAIHLPRQPEVNSNRSVTKDIVVSNALFAISKHYFALASFD